jgi:predicted MPP superfamily phosphohydrolase
VGAPTSRPGRPEAGPHRSSFARQRRRLRIARRALLVLFGTAAVLAAWGFLWEPSRLTTRRYELTLPRWPPSCDGLRVAVAGDLHVGSPHYGVAKLPAVVDAIAGLRPDLVLLPGDFVIQGVIGGTVVPPETIARGLAPLPRLAPTYAVLGNHDWWLEGPRVSRALGGAGIPTLDDSARELHLGDCSLWLVGIGDLWSGHPRPDRALATVPAGTAALGFMHNPDLFPRLPDRFALVVAAHTHGGQVYLPMLGRLIVPSRYGQRYAIGHVVEGGRHLFVTPGLGTSILPVRFLVPPEVSLLVLHGEPAAKR